MDINSHTGSPVAIARGDNQITYNGRIHVARTADGVEITSGMRVFTNNLDRGTVDLAGANWDWHEPEGVYHLWFYVDVDTDYRGNPVSQRYSQSDDRVVTKFKGKNA